MKIGIGYRPQFQFELTKPQIDVLIKLSARHYDAWCKSYAGGKYAGWLNRIENGFPHLTADWHDLDTALKVMEMPFGLTNDEMIMVAELTMSFHRALSRARDRLECTHDEVDV